MTTAQWATVIIATFGCITGVAGFIKSLLVDRRVRLEPYLKNVWSEVRLPLDSYMRIIPPKIAIAKFFQENTPA